MTIAIEASLLADVRANFPSLAACDGGRSRIYLDNPAGTQVPRQVIDRVSHYYASTNANYGGTFRTSIETTELVILARQRMAAFLGASDPSEVILGPNMTSLTFAMTRALRPLFRPGDEIVLTRMDHDGNVTPWTLLADDLGLTVRWLDFDPATSRYRLDQLDRLLNRRTRLAAINYASNITGTINPVARIARRLRSAGVLSYVDAVQYAPHGMIDVAGLGCDFLVCSAYKFYGPHAGVLWGRREILEKLHPPRLRAASATVPGRFETGCGNFEGMAGILGALDYYNWLGERCPESPTLTPANRAKHWMQAHEAALTDQLIQGLQALPGVRIHGLTDPTDAHERVSTVSISVDGRDPRELSERLARHNIFTWSGHNYAIGVIERLGLHDLGGVLRFGPVHYNTAAEIDETLNRLEDCL